MLIRLDVDLELLEVERDLFDLIKEEFNEVCCVYEELLEEIYDKDEVYWWYDVWDREYFECRMRIVEYLYVMERRL